MSLVRSPQMGKRSIVPPVRPGVVVIRDTIARANSALLPGAADTGGAYTVAAGTVGVIGNAFYAPDGDESIIAISSQRPARRIEATLFGADLVQYAPMLILRYVDAANFLYVAPTAAHTLILVERVASVETLLDTSAVVSSIAAGAASRVIALFNGAAYEFAADSHIALDGTLASPVVARVGAAAKVAFGFRNDSDPADVSSTARVSDILVYA